MISGERQDVAYLEYVAWARIFVILEIRVLLERDGSISRIEDALKHAADLCDLITGKGERVAPESSVAALIDRAIALVACSKQRALTNEQRLASSVD